MGGAFFRRERAKSEAAQLKATRLVLQYGQLGLVNQLQIAKSEGCFQSAHLGPGRIEFHYHVPIAVQPKNQGMKYQLGYLDR